MTDQPHHADGKPEAGRPRVLVVDDHEVGRKSLTRLLDALGHEVVSVSSGTAALEFMDRDRRLDYLLVDLRLPDLDGRDVARAAREILPEAGIGLITGWDVDPDEVARMGVDWVFLKPLNVQEIVARFREVPPAGRCP